MNEYKHTDINGKEYSLSELKLSHLINIIKRIKRRSKEGITFLMGGGCHDDMWCDDDTIYGKEVKDHMNYKQYKKELKRRKKVSKDIVISF